VNSPWHHANLSSWNVRAALHARDETGTYDVGGFLAGRDKLHSTNERLRSPATPTVSDMVSPSKLGQAQSGMGVSAVKVQAGTR
jgi:hypothetical protein